MQLLLLIFGFFPQFGFPSNGSILLLLDLLYQNIWLDKVGFVEVHK